MRNRKKVSLNKFAILREHSNAHVVSEKEISMKLRFTADLLLFLLDVLSLVRCISVSDIQLSQLEDLFCSENDRK